jgi:hypothetical protein
MAFSQLLTETHESAPGGMNLALPAQEIDDMGARYMQDILLHKPGLMVRRGPMSPISGYAQTPKFASGLAQTLDPTGAFRIAALYGDASSGSLGLYSADLSTITAIPWNGTLPTTGGSPSTAYRIVDAKSGLTGGTWIGTSSQYDANSPVQTLAIWRGGNKADYATGTITVTRGGVTVTGVGTSWLAQLSPGMFLFANTDDPYTLAYIGVVKLVNSDTNLTLGAVSPHACTAKGYNATSIRGFCPRVVTGRITTSTSSTQVNGASTKFLTQGVNSGTWQLYRASDLGFIGKVSSVTNDTTIVLTANAALATANERYVLIRVDGDYSINVQAVAGRKVGFLTALYASRQWFANLGQQFETVSRVFFSDPSDPEAVDLSPFDGDFIDVASTTGVNTPIKAIMPAYNALLIIKDTETFGIYGASKSQFQVRKIEDDGTLSGMSVQPYGGGVIWAGRDGIYYYDGIEAKNVTLDSLGDYYKNAVRSFDPNSYRMWSFLDRDHYFLFMERVAPNTGPVKGVVSTTPTAITICLNMVTKAVTLQTNVAPRGAITLPASTGETAWFILNDSLTTKGCIVDASVMFDQQGNDTILDAGFPALGPDLYFESKKYKVGDSLRKKLFKQLAIHYLAQGGVVDANGVLMSLKLDTVVGLNNVGRTSLTQLPATVYSWDQLAGIAATWDALSSLFPSWDSVVQANFLPKRIKFLRRSQHMAFRIYQTSSAVTQVQLGPFQLGFKLQRPGRI